MTLLKTQVLIVGGGATGAGLARDLSLRGVPCLLVERGDIAAGASGANHGLLHSGARYVAKDPQAAMECAVEGAILKKVAAGCIEDTGGLFVAVAGDDERYVADFPSHCHTCGVACEPLALGEAREMEPVLSEKLIAAFKVPAHVAFQTEELPKNASGKTLKRVLKQAFVDQRDAGEDRPDRCAQRCQSFWESWNLFISIA